MTKKIIIIIITLLMVPISIFLYEKNEEVEIPATESGMEAKVKVAACPTCFPLLESKISNSPEYDLIFTGSTGESIRLLVNGQADMILAGRKLKPGEPDLDRHILEDGYSFLSSSQMLIYKEDLPDHRIFTDLDPEKIRSAFSLPEVTEVNDVYEYLDQGVVITSWDDTDYSKAKIIHLYKKNGERVKLSRRPTLYCPGSCDDKKAKRLISIINNNQ